MCTIIINCTVVEVEENTTIKLEVAVATWGCIPNSKNKGQKINPPPIPNKPAHIPVKKAYKG